MTLPEVFRVALLKTRPQIEQRVLTQPHGHGICPQVETVLLGLPPGLSAAACKEIWQKLSDKPFDLVLDGREPSPDDSDLQDIVGPDR